MKLRYYIGVLLACNLMAQNSEFKTYSNGLIYSPNTMTHLSKIVDSLNLKFKSCDLKAFYGMKQTVCCKFVIKSGNILSAIKDMGAGMLPEEMIKKYPEANVSKEVLVVRWDFKNYEGKDMIEFSEITLGENGRVSIERENTKANNVDLKNSWLYEHESDGLRAFYFTSNPEAKKMPDKYAQMVGYSDCMIDTTTTKFKEKTENGWIGLPENHEKLSDKQKLALLDKMRGTHVMGFCSMDSRPRIHAANIAILSAETYKWEVFLKAHLDIMNDRFDRASDGSYAQPGRMTYIKELEELNINVPDLIFGIMFRVDKCAKNHYYGSTGRVGRALAESKNKTELEKNMLTMIADPQLDDYNRAVIFYLYDNYIYYLKDEAEKTDNKNKLKLAVLQLPSYLKEGVKIE